MVRIFVSSRRPCDSDAFATSSYGTNFAHPLSAATFVSAAVKVVFPWSMCPIVPTFTCGFERSNFSLAICDVRPIRSLMPRGVLPRPVFCYRFLPARVRPVSPDLPLEARRHRPWRAKDGADDQDRTGDLVLTKDVLCQLSYIGLRAP